MQNTLSSTIAVLGAGAWGTALSMVLARGGHNVQLWDRDESLLDVMIKTKCNRYLPEIVLPSNIVVCRNLNEVLEKAQDILMVVPSHAFSSALLSLKPFLAQYPRRFIWATKGLESKTGDFLHQVVEREMGADFAYAVLSGPSFALEVAKGLPTAVALASKDLQFAEAMATLFRHDTFSVDTTDDIIGVQLGAVVKNVLAVAVGISDGVHFGANTRAALITHGLVEMMRLGKALGARSETLMGLAGLGDAILTCTDNQSRNRRFGLALAEGLTEEHALKRVGQVVEAVHNVEQLLQLAKKNNIELPITEQVFRVTKHGISPKEAMSELFRTIKS
jgi:glycerol-3-phosphate dehydrogenase (NAD(P)+)